MTMIRQNIWIAAVFLCIASCACAREGAVYSQVMQTLEKQDQRLAGGAAFYEAVDVLETVLQKHGLQTHRQTYTTLVPKTKRCVFTVNTREIGPIYPLAPNGVMPVTTGGESLTGPLVYLGDGSLAAMRNKPVDGCIALLDFSSRAMRQVFSQGAKAVVFVGDPRANQWQVAEHFTEMFASMPRFYMARETAEAQGLLVEGGAATSYPDASLDAAVVWESVQTANLWTFLPGESGKTFKLDSEEVVCLTATLDTFGAVPDYCPQQRGAVNVALLAQVAANLSKQQPVRGVLVGFLGSHYASQEGARHFFWALDKAEKGNQNSDPLDKREGFYSEELQQIESRLVLLGQADYLTANHDEKTAVDQCLRTKLDAWVNGLNFRLREIAIRRQEESFEPTQAFLVMEAQLRHEKRIWNELKRQLFDRKMDAPHPLLGEEDVVDRAAFCVRLAACGADNASSLQKRVWAELSVPVRASIQTAAQRILASEKPLPEPLDEKVFRAILEAVNLVLSLDDFATLDTFEALQSSYTINSLLARFPHRLSQAESRFLNRLLLEVVLEDSVNRCIFYPSHFSYLKTEVKRDFLRRLQELKTFLANNQSHQELMQTMLVPLAPDAKPDEEQKTRRLIGHFAFDFADGNAPWTFLMGGDPTHQIPSPINQGVCLKHLSALGKVYRSVLNPAWTGQLYQPALKGGYGAASLSTPQHRSLSCTTPHALGIFGYHLVTVADSLDYDEMPVRETRTLLSLVPQLTTYCTALAATPDLSIRSSMKRGTFESGAMFIRDDGGRPQGISYQFIAKGSTEQEGPAWGSIAVAYNGLNTYLPDPLVGHSRMGISPVYGNGYLFSPLLNRHVAPWLRLAIAFDESGQIERISDTVKRDHLFYACGGAIVRPMNPKSYNIPELASLLNARNNSTFKNQIVFQNLQYSAFYVDRNVDYKYVGNGLALLGGIGENPMGLGLPLDAGQMLRSNASRQTAHDYILLNKHRLAALIRRNIVNDSIQSLWTEAEDHYGKADEARASGDISRATANETYATVLGYRAYEPLRTIANDMVQAVVILMLMSIPFAFAMERLLFGFPTIYKQIAGFTGMFLLTFLILYFAHPAFSLADAPTMIFLAFVIILLSGLVIFIVMSKFRHEIKAMQGLVSKVHNTSSESSTALASVLIGISGMRNRPLKTLLTAATIVLLTFTILVFSSFSSKLGVVRTYFGKGQGEPRIEVHRASYLTLPEILSQSIDVLSDGTMRAFRRSACFSDPLTRKFNKAPSPENLLYNPENGKTFLLKAVLGIEPGETERNASLAQLLPVFATIAKSVGDAPERDAVPPILLSDIAVKTLGVKEKDIVFLRGRRFRYLGQFDNATFQSYANVDGTKLLPPDYDATLTETDVSAGAAGNQLEESLENIDISSFVWTSTDLTAVTTYGALADLGALQNFLTLYPEKRDVLLDREAESISRVFRGPVYLQSGVGAERFFFTRALEGSGMSEILVPLILGGLIIFSSLLGSIVDREREIFTYSALGLAPPDVATLFFAESSVYAILGGMGGYLFSQLIAKFLTILSTVGLFQPPEMNFSALSSIYTILLVMGTVILSTIYPALKAGKSANPGVARKWKMPLPEGNRLQFMFPFTVSESDLAGVLSFVREYFNSHQDASLGSFAARDIRIFRRSAEETGGEEGLGIAATLSLAPFDLGVFQNFALYSSSSDIEGIEEVVIEIERVSGPPGAWMRSNRAFIDELRNQFLLWRSLPMETVEYYRQLTTRTLDNMAAGVQDQVGD